MAAPLLKDGFLEDALALARLYHAVHLVCRRLLASHGVYPPFHHLPAASVRSGHARRLRLMSQAPGSKPLQSHGES